MGELDFPVGGQVLQTSNFPEEDSRKVEGSSDPECVAGIPINCKRLVNQAWPVHRMRRRAVT